jgi:ABC-type amino acid transport substrate-binding protein
MLMTLTTTALAVLLQQGQADAVAADAPAPRAVHKETFDVVTIDVWRPKKRPQRRLSIGDMRRRDFTSSLKASVDAL